MAIFVLKHDPWELLPIGAKRRAFIITDHEGHQIPMLSYGLMTLFAIFDKYGHGLNHTVVEVKPLPAYAQPKSPIVKQLAMALGIPVVDLPLVKMKPVDRIGMPTLKRRAPMLTIKKIPHTPTTFDKKHRDNKAVVAQLSIFPAARLSELAQALGLVAVKEGVPRPTHLAVREGYMTYSRDEDGKNPKMNYTNKGIRLIKEYLHHIPK